MIDKKIPQKVWSKLLCFDRFYKNITSTFTSCQIEKVKNYSIPAIKRLKSVTLLAANNDCAFMQKRLVVISNPIIE